MSSHETAVHIPTFGKWLLQQYKRNLFFFPSLATLTGLGSVVASAMKLLGSPWFRPSIFLFQALLCCILLFLVPPATASNKISDRATTATGQFLDAWKRLWMFWVFLYLTFFAREMGEIFFKVQLQHPDGSFPAWWRYGWIWLLNVMSNLQTLSLVMLYLAITKSTVDTNQNESKLPWTAGLAVFAVITIVDMVAVIGSLTPNMQAQAGEISVAVRQIFMWASGFLAGIAVALVVGRFDNKYIDPPTWAVILFYFYALIQVPWGAFENKVLETVITSAALLLKSLLFLFVAWLLETGILFFFVDRVAHLISTSRNERDEYLKQLAIK